MTDSDDHKDASPRSAGTPAAFDTTTPHPARVYDYWLGGKDNFAADRDAAERALALVPEMRLYALSNRRFLTRATRILADRGILQFLDLGTGLPNSPNIHDVAQATHPTARVVYVDNDPIVTAHARALLATDTGTLAIQADLRDTADVLKQASNLLDFTQPVALMFVATLRHVPDEDNPAAIVAGLRSSHAATLTSCGCSLAATSSSPGSSQVSYWRPDGGPELRADRVFAYGGVARL